jgi:hypothetical protein
VAQGEKKSIDDVAPRNHSSMIDLAVLYAIKFARVMVIWIALYAIDKVWQDAYVKSIVKNEDAGAEVQEPPSMLPLVVITLGAEAVFMMVVVLCLVLAGAMFGGPASTYVLDAGLLRLIGIDYILSTVVIAGIGLTVSSVTQDGRLFRFRDDGMRGIRATCSLLLSIAAVVIALPLFALVSWPHV